VKEAGIKNFTWHDLRHTFASRLVMAGVDLRKIQDLMGHKTIEMTVRYTHLRRDDLNEAVETLVSQPTATSAATSPETALSGGSKVVQ